MPNPTDSKPIFHWSVSHHLIYLSKSIPSGSPEILQLMLIQNPFCPQPTTNCQILLSFPLGYPVYSTLLYGSSPHCFSLNTTVLAFTLVTSLSVLEPAPVPTMESLSPQPEAKALLFQLWLPH